MMLTGIDPVLSGAILAQLDAMGHSDSVVLADAHFPAARLAREWIDLPLVTTPRLLRAIARLVPPDDAPSLHLMASGDGGLLPVQEELLAAAEVTAADAGFLDRFEFYGKVADASLVIRTGETRIYGNALWRKGVVDASEWTA
jgi:L-fucose mutarotase